MASRTAIETELPFDLNVGNVLEHWTVPFAIRELIANALDESLITGHHKPPMQALRTWVLSDPGPPDSGSLLGGESETSTGG